jgi:hypothetical protein
MALGDTVTYYLTGKLGGGTVTMLTDSVQVTGNDLNPPKPLVFTVAKKEIEALASGSIEVYYTVDTFTRALLKPSDTLIVSVAGALRLPPPSVDHVVNGFLDPATAPAGTDVRVATTYLGAVKGDIARVLWNGKDAASSYSNSFAVTPGTEVVCPIAVTFITANVSTQVSATYQIERSGQPIRYADALPFRIERDDTPAFTIDHSPVTLKVGETAQREATGGTTPYTYWSSDATVASVNAANGTVTANATGVAAIGAGDAANHLATYPVTVGTGGPPFAIDHTTMTLTVGGTGQRQATGGSTPYRYASSSTAVAAVHASTGVVTANAVGAASITANDALNASDFYAVSVTAVAPPFTIHPATMTLKVGGTEQRQATGGTTPYSYASSDAAVATVNTSTGVVTANAVGSTSIIAKDARDNSASYAVAVSAVAPPFTIDSSPVTLSVGDTRQRQATGGAPPYNYTTDTPLVATVHASTGQVTAKAAGATNITARDTANGSGSYRVTVKAIAPPLYIDQSMMTLEVGERDERQATGGVPPYAYETSDLNVVGVGNSGGTLAFAPGSATITVRDSANGSGSYPVTVTAAFDIAIGPVTLTGIQTFERNASGGTPPYNYVSSTPGVVKVPNPTQGTIQSVSDGLARVTASDQAGSSGHYDVTVTGNTIPFTIDTKPVTLTGTQTFLREASGGVRPYAYVSSAPGVTKVTNPTQGNIQAVSDGRARITVSDNTGTSLAYDVTVTGNTLPLTIDQMPMVLGGAIYRAPNVVLTPPPGAFAVRQASGGRPPYSYRAENPTIVDVDPLSGRVISRAAGSTQVIATDSASQQVSYQVSVSNVAMFFGTGIHGTYTQCRKGAEAQGGRLPSLSEWAALRACYNGVPGFGNGLAWATDSPGTGKRWAIQPDSGLTQALVDLGIGGGTADGFGWKK